MSVHISAGKGAIAPVVLMPGDPLRAKYIAENWLDNPVLVSSVRNMFYFTGEYKGHRITIGGSGMGCPSIGIYSYELYSEYDVDCIIRIGTAGSYSRDLGLYEVINVETACSESTYALNAFGMEGEVMLNRGNAYNMINHTAFEKGLAIKNGAIHSSDVFYRAEQGLPALAERHSCMAVEMEAFALFANASYLGKTAATILTISDVIPTGEQISADAREKSLKPMIELALDAAVNLMK